MAKQRDKIRMSPEEVAAFLDGSKSLIVATLDKEGAPHQTVLWFARQGDTILFETYGSSQKILNLRRDPRLSVLCEQGETYGELRGVSIQGSTEIVDSGPRLAELMSFIVTRNMPGLSPDALAAHVAMMVQKRVVVVVHPRRVISWDHRVRIRRHAPNDLVPPHGAVPAGPSGLHQRFVLREDLGHVCHAASLIGCSITSGADRTRGGR